MTHPQVAEYLARLEAEARALPADRRAELVAEVSSHIESALAEDGTDEATVRNVLERLGSPAEIAAEALSAEPDAPVASAAPDAAVPAARPTGWGPTEILAVAALIGAWVALAFQAQLTLWTSAILWLGLGVLGMVLVALSNRWSRRNKQVTIGLFASLYALVLLVAVATIPVSTSGGQAPSPSVTVVSAS